jgi:hypothetical protein
MNAFWQVKLAATPEEVARFTVGKVDNNIKQTCNLHSQLGTQDPACEPLKYPILKTEDEFGERCKQ